MANRNLRKIARIRGANQKTTSTQKQKSYHIRSSLKPNKLIKMPVQKRSEAA